MNIKMAERRIIVIVRAIEQRVLSLIGEISEIWPWKVFFSCLNSSGYRSGVLLNSFNIRFLGAGI
jgi:hypothetical protein